MNQQGEAATDLEALQQRYADAWRARDPDAIIALHTEDTQFRTHAGGEAIEGKAAMRTAAVETFERFPQFSSEPHQLLFGPEHWVLEWTLVSGEVRFDCIDLVVVADGLVKTKDTYFDFVQVQATMPAPPSD